MIDWNQTLLMAALGAAVGGGIGVLYYGVRWLITSGKKDKKRK